MAVCARCGKEGNNLFKGRYLCLEDFNNVLRQVSEIIDSREASEGRAIPEDEPISIQSPRLVGDEFGRVYRTRGQHFTISKKDLKQKI